jgi:heme exporter protein C
MSSLAGRRDTVIGSVAAALLVISAVSWFVSPAIFYPIGDRLVECQACRIMYFHVPSAWLAYLAFFVVFVASIQVLRTELPRWDALARSSAEVGLMFTTLALLTGSLWGKPVWGTWWTWDARLTLTLFLWFVGVGYLILRGAVEDHGTRARFSAVLGILAALLVPFIHLSVYLFRTLHPMPIVLKPSAPSMPREMTVTFALAFLAFTLLFAAFVRARYRIAVRRDALLAREEGLA